MLKYINMVGKYGFTIIELVVVIAIITVLAAIVLISVDTYIKKSMDAAIKADLDVLAKIGPNYFVDNQNYLNFCLNPDVIAIKNAIWKMSGVLEDGEGWKCNVSTGVNLNNAWCACSILKNNKYWCVDSTGYKKETVTSCDQRCGTASNINGKCGE